LHSLTHRPYTLLYINVFLSPTSFIFFFFHHPATTEIYTLSYTTLFRSRSKNRATLGCSIAATASASCWKRARNSGSASSIGCSTDRKSTRLNSSHVAISYAVFCLKKKNDPFVPVYFLFSLYTA